MNHHLGNLGIYSQSSSKSKNVKYGLAGYKSVLVTSWGGHHFPGLATMILTHNWDVKWSSKGWWMGWLRLYIYIYILVGGLEHGFYVFHIYIGNFIIPTDELIFLRGVGIPPTSISMAIESIAMLPSGKRLHNYGKSPCYKWVNPLFLWAIFNSELLVNHYNPH